MRVPRGFCFGVDAAPGRCGRSGRSCRRRGASAPWTRTTTPRTTSPGFTSPPGIAFLTLAMIMSPRPGVAPPGAAQHLDAHAFLGAGVVGHVQVRIHLNHDMSNDLPCCQIKITGSSRPMQFVSPGQLRKQPSTVCWSRLIKTLSSCRGPDVQPPSTVGAAVAALVHDRAPAASVCLGQRPVSMISTVSPCATRSSRRGRGRWSGA